MQISPQMIAEMKELGRKDGKEWTDDEAYEAARNLTGLAKLMYEISIKEAKRKARLRKEPKGFPVEGMYSCVVCRNGINPETGWYDSNGNKCLQCQKALNEGVITAFVCKNDDSFFTMSGLKYTFNLKHHAIKKYIKEEKLRPRLILNEDGSVHEYIFLKKENPALVERYNPVRKSYDRYRAKMSEKWSREKAKELKEEWQERRKKLSKA